MLISLIVINLNRAKALERCLASIIAQRHRPLEIVILDHGSTDGSKAVIDSFTQKAAERGVRVKPLLSERMGVSASRNFAARHASGDLLCFMDNDACFTSPEDLARCARIFHSRPSCALVSFRILQKDSARPDPATWVFRRSPEAWSGRTFKTFTFTGGGCCIRRQAFNNEGGFWGSLIYSREEEDLSYALIDRGYDIVYSPSVTIRHYPDSTGRSSISGRRYVELVNGILVIWRRLPIIIAVPAIAARTASMVAKGLIRREAHPKELIKATAEALVRFNEGKRMPVSFRAVWRVIALHFAES